MKDRRSFLKLFGLSSAAIATVDAHGETVIEQHRDVPVTGGPIAEKERELETLKSYNLFRTGWLYSALEIPRNSMRSSYPNLFGYSDYFSSGDTVRRPTLADTNMERPGSLPMPEMFAVRRIGVLFSGTTLPALRAAFAERYTLSFYVGSRRYWEAPIASMFGVGEIENIDRSALGFVNLEIPLIIPSGQQFNAMIQGTPLSPHGRIRLWAVIGDIEMAAVY
jgi:hypothetical protein